MSPTSSWSWSTGEPLSQMIARGPMNPDQVRGIVGQAALALAAAHAAGRGPPRRQAGQHPHHPRRPGEADRLRHRARGRRRVAYPDRRGARHPAVPLPGAGPRQGRHRGQRPLRAGHHRAGDAHRAQARSTPARPSRPRSPRSTTRRRRCRTGSRRTCARDRRPESGQGPGRPADVCGSRRGRPRYVRHRARADPAGDQRRPHRRHRPRRHPGHGRADRHRAAGRRRRSTPTRTTRRGTTRVRGRRSSLRALPAAARRSRRRGGGIGLLVDPDHRPARRHRVLRVGATPATTAAGHRRSTTTRDRGRLEHLGDSSTSRRTVDRRRTTAARRRRHPEHDVDDAQVVINKADYVGKSYDEAKGILEGAGWKDDQIKRADQAGKEAARDGRRHQADGEGGRGNSDYADGLGRQRDGGPQGRARKAAMARETDPRRGRR